MHIASDESISTWDQSLKRIQEAGNRVMSFSGLRYEGRYVSAGEFDRVHVMEFGEGPPVLLMHGAGGCGAVWHRQIAALADTHRVIVPDIPMFGLSEMPSHVYAPRRQIADVILGVMDVLDIEASCIVGHSMGAIGSLGAMIEAPDRFNRAVLMASPGFGRGLNWLLRFASVPASRRFVRYDSKKDRYFFFDRFEAQKSGPSEEREAWKEMVFEIGNRHNGADTFRQGLRSFTGLLGQRDVLSDEDLAKLDTPILFVWGDSDRIIPTRHSNRAVQSVPNARLEIIENCGHIVQLEAALQTTELVVNWFRN